MRIYVGNKMRGLPDSNYPWFDRAAKYLKELGHDPITPKDIDEKYGLAQGNAQAEYSAVAQGLRLDFLEIMDADAIALGPQWEDSFGAKAEKQVAEWINIPVYYVDPDKDEFWLQIVSMG